MPTTTNYSWTTPADTDLVKDGASAIRTLGSAIDTTTKNLNPSTTLGDIEYRSSTANTNTRLAIGSAGQVLTVSGGVPAWGNAGSLTLISTTTLSGATTTISSIPSTYRHLQLVIENLRQVDDGTRLAIRFNADSGANRHYVANTFGLISQTAFNATSALISDYVDNGTPSKFHLILDIPNYADTSVWKIGRNVCVGEDWQTTGQFSLLNNVILYNQTAAISSLSLFMNSGNFTSGTAFLYGVS